MITSFRNGGWVQCVYGKSRRDGDCLILAINRCAVSDSSRRRVRDLIMMHMDWNDVAQAYTWNDAPETKLEDVIQLLEEVKAKIPWWSLQPA